MPGGSDIFAQSAIELATAIRSRVVSPLEVFDSFSARIEAVNPEINAFVTLDLERAREQAKRAEQAVDDGAPLGLLHGIPVGIKDLTATAGLRTTYGSLLFKDFVPKEDDAIVRKLRDNGAIILGKTTTPEFGSHVVTQSPVFGTTRNPWDPSYTPGGSSGGSAAAVITRMLPVAHGNDGGGSIRIPASFCGTFGFKPSYGRLSNAQSSDYYSTIAHHGPLANTVDDGVLMFRAMIDYDSRDPYSLPKDNLSAVLEHRDSLSGLKVAWSLDLGYAEVDPEVSRLTSEAVRTFSELGAEVEEDHPGFEDPRPFFNHIIALHMGAVVEEHLPEKRGLLGTTMLAILEEMEKLSPWDMARALRLRSKLHEKVIAFFERYDLLVTPTMGALAPSADAPLGPDLRIEGMYFTHPFNLTHLPAASVPAGWSQGGLPIGLQVIAGPRQDGLALRACAAYEQARPWSGRMPPAGEAWTSAT